ncbi:DNA repair protein RecO [Paenibacillus baekrokdamisoli]|uniref:DNA repair protein RecO n=1 Tax=Paenibacillus baekrokdamisoli TaxID=1712516 RepID=A0A3G9J681_9BACL|nr:DNA repair protein RecO [Paenibacillus baekrokdamisoli]MBB3070266.1 DNA repair protein RecO (recombination protein O) [Paenibacillus baekrokdamisoli]BBH21271.1 DNA repair protein RecO [Paenibacillus baekrokdamisoli]
MQYRVEGIVIRSMDYGENNKIVTIYTKTHGKVGIVVRGAKKAKSRHGSMTQLFTHGEFIYFRNSGLGTLTHGEIIQSHHVLREQLEMAAYSSYAAELTDRVLQEEDASGYMYEQLHACLTAIEEGKDGEIIIQLFELKILEAAGYGPNFESCTSCDNDQGSMALSARFGGVLCERCRYKDTSALVLNEGTLKLLRLFRRMDLRRLGAIQVKDETKKQLKQALRLLMDTHIGITLKSRSFIDQMDKFSI